MKLLHSADWHLGAPIQGRTPAQTALLRRSLAELPEKVVSLARREGCDLVLLSGDLFDGACSPESLSAVQKALASAAVPVFIAPGNHDPAGPLSPWEREGWPENVHIFRSAAVQSVALPQLDCRVWGAAFQRAHSAPLLDEFHAEGKERFALGVFHGDPTQPDSPYNAINRMQVQESGLDYLALGHIHKSDSFIAGDTLCAWPGCAMGKGFDETGSKGVLIVTLEGSCEITFRPLPGPRFHRLTAQVQNSAFSALSAVLPALESEDFFRVTFTGESEPVDLEALYTRFSGFPNLELLDETTAPLPLWGASGEDTLEGIYFSLLQQADAPEETKKLAARISRQLLLEQEVELP